MTYDDAKKAADSILAEIKPLCLRACIAGSIRRQKQDDIKDVEVCAIPMPIHLSKLYDIVNLKWGQPSIGKFPSKYTRVRAAYNIDFFWTTPEAWGMCYFIRTGSADFVKRALGHWKKITQGGYSQDCILHRADGTIVPTLTEEAVFEALKVRFVPPERRK